MAAVRIIAEGAAILNSGIKNLLERALNDKLLDWRVICSGGLKETIGAFIRGLEDVAQGKTNDSVLLLLDSDEYVPVDADMVATLFAHKGLNDAYDTRLKQRLASYNIRNEQVYFMVQEMEALFLADEDSLRVYFGTQNIELGPRTQPGDIEQISKPAEELMQMTGRQYKKASHAAVIFYHLDPAQLEQMPHFRRLLDHLRQLLIKQQEEAS